MVARACIKLPVIYFSSCVTLTHPLLRRIHLLLFIIYALCLSIIQALHSFIVRAHNHLSHLIRRTYFSFMCCTYFSFILRIHFSFMCCIHPSFMYQHHVQKIAIYVSYSLIVLCIANFHYPCIMYTALCSLARLFSSSL